MLTISSSSPRAFNSDRISSRAFHDSQLHQFQGYFIYARQNPWKHINLKLTLSISLIVAYLGTGVLLSYRDATAATLFPEPSNAKAARPKPTAPADTAKAAAERPVHLEAVCPDVAVLVVAVLLPPVEDGLFREVFTENVRRQPPTRRRVALFADI